MPLSVKFIIGSFVVLILTAVWADHQPWRKAEGTHIVFRQPLAGSLALGGFGFLGMIGALLVVLAGSGGNGGPLFLFLIVALVLCLAAGLMFLMAGLRRELILDTQQRTYRFTSGWGRSPAVYSGSFEDFGGAFVRKPSGRSKSEQYSAGLIWKSGGRRTPLLGMGGKLQEMEALAEEMVRVLGVPLVSAPPPETYWEMLRRRPGA